jgi:hypothetical protein
MGFLLTLSRAYLPCLWLPRSRNRHFTQGASACLTAQVMATTSSPLIVIAFLSRFPSDIVGRFLLVVFSFAAAGAYLGFTLLAAPGAIWVLAELVQVIIFGAIALLGLRGFPWWLATG